MLGISRNASASDVKKAYISLAKKYHPDANAGNDSATAMFAEVAEAYTVLSNKQQRAAYDGESSGGGGGSSNSEDFDPVRRSWRTHGAAFHSSVDPEDLFRKIFGAEFKDLGGAGGRSKKGKVWVDYAPPASGGHEKTEATILRLTFREAAKGCEKLITAKTVATCEKCMGLG